MIEEWEWSVFGSSMRVSEVSGARIYEGLGCLHSTMPITNNIHNEIWSTQCWPSANCTLPKSAHSLLMERRSLTSWDPTNVMETRSPAGGYPGGLRLPCLTHRFVVLKYYRAWKVAEQAKGWEWTRHRLPSCHIRKCDMSNVSYLPHLTSLQLGHMVGGRMTWAGGGASISHLSFVSLIYPSTHHWPSAPGSSHPAQPGSTQPQRHRLHKSVIC